ncbi:MAG: dTDP-4-dehydrorhamnose reductase [Lachnospiraceae bacterium]|nr:dTDP-4-dehydrorhamnose reductase [Lachnospiraceae bacterium]
MGKKKILVTGSNGQLGHALQSIYAGESEYEMLWTDAPGIACERTLDITAPKEVLALFEEVRPDYVINCAAYTNVDACEKNRELAFKVNGEGPGNLAKAARETGAIMVHISTDYVFDGKPRELPYVETDMPDPLSAYGESKLMGENAVKENNRYFILRTAWLYGEGHNFVRTMLRIAKTHERITVVNDQLGSPTSALELARAIRFLLPSAHYGLYHATAEGSCSWAEFAQRIFELAGLETTVVPVSTKQYMEMVPGQAKRPAFSVLENAGLKALGYEFKTWQAGLEEYMQDRKEMPT